MPKTRFLTAKSGCKPINTDVSSYSFDSGVFTPPSTVCLPAHHGEFQLLEVVAICDHLGFFIERELKQEVAREAFPVAFDLLIESLGLHAVQRSQKTRFFQALSTGCKLFSLQNRHGDP